MLVCGDVVYAQTWQVLTLKNFIEPLSYAGLFCCMALVSFRLFCKNLGNLQQFFGQMDYRPHWQKIAFKASSNCSIIFSSESASL